jgi:hypothetical protein
LLICFPFRLVFASCDATKKKSNQRAAMYHFKNAELLRVTV